VVIVMHGNVVSGNISTPGARYHIRFAGNGAHEVQEIDRSLFPRDEPDVPNSDESALDTGAANALAPPQNPSAQADENASACGRARNSWIKVNVIWLNVLYSRHIRQALQCTEPSKRESTGLSP
jgi:hypothetical protein